MSDAPQRLFPDPEPLNRSERIVLDHIAMYCDDDQRLVQSARYIANATLLSQPAVQNAINRLNELQLIRTLAGSPVRTSEHIFLKWDTGRSERDKASARTGPASGRSPRVRFRRRPMSAAAATKPNGTAFTRTSKPEIIQRLEAEYWVSMPLEMIEAPIGRRKAKWRVYYAIIRCSFSLPSFSPIALRPSLRKGKFPEWVERLHQRLGENRKIRPGECNDERPARDDNEKEIPLKPEDLALITRLSKSHLSETLKELRRDGLIGPGFPFYAVAAPQAAPPPVNSDPKVPFEGNSELPFLVRKLENLLGIKVPFEGNSEVASKVLTKHFEAIKLSLTEVRQKARENLIQDLEGNGILIKKEE